MDGDPLARAHSKYQSVRRLGNGAFGIVNQARLLSPSQACDEEFVAIKFIPRDKTTPKCLEAEVLNMRKLDHPHIIAFREIFLTREYICLVMEYAPGGTLKSLMKRTGPLPETRARWFFQQLMLAVDYSHQRGIVNRDIKLENSLLMRTEPPLLKISDFGLSKDARNSSPRSFVGTLRGGYIAPEVLEAEGRSTYDGTAADVWSCGVMLYYMIFNQGPFCAEQSGETATRDFIRLMLARQRKSEYTIPQGISASGELWHLIQQMLQPVAANRISVAEIMAHPWFTVGLPPGAANMNKMYLQHGYLQEGRQSEEDVKDILAEVRAGFARAVRQGTRDPRPDPNAAGMNCRGDEMNTMFIDDEIDGYRLEHPSGFET